MDFVFDQSADGRGIKWLTIFGDATHSSVGIEVERAISGYYSAAVGSTVKDPCAQADNCADSTYVRLSDGSFTSTIAAV